MAATKNSSSFLGRLAQVLSVRRWIIVVALALGAGAGIGFSQRQDVRYEAQSQLLVSRTKARDVLTGSQTSRPPESDLRRIVRTQADLLRVPRVARRTLDRAGLRGRSTDAFLKRSSVTTDPSTDLLTLRVVDEQRAVAIRLADAYAREFLGYKRDQTAARVLAVSTDLERELGELAPVSDEAREVRTQLRRIRNLAALDEASIEAVQTPSTAVLTQPKTLRNAVLGLLSGLVLGLALAFLRHAFDSRLRRSRDIEQRLDLPLLGRLEAPPTALAREDRLATLLDPTGPDAESFRVLRTNLEFAGLGGGGRSVIVTSAVRSEGKSTTAANLALAMARGGKRVILCDCDFRRPQLERFFELAREPGATGVVLGRATVEQALVEFDVGAATAAGVPGFHGPSSNDSAAAAGGGRLQLLPTGALPRNVGEFVTSDALGDLLARLSARCDVLLLDAPPLLQGGDAMALTSHVDAILLVARLGHVRRQMLDEVKRLFDSTPAVALGVVVTNANLEPGRGYGYRYDERDLQTRPERDPEEPADLSTASR